MASLKKNIIFLGFVQVAQFVVPLLQFPYLSRVVGVEGFAVYVYALSLLHFLSVIVDYGFSVYLPQRVALARADRLELNKIFTSAFVIKSVFIFPTMVAYLLVAELYHANVKDGFFLIMALAMIFNGCSLMWLYQGLEELRFFALLNVFIKAVGVSLVFFFVNSKDDLLALALINLAQFFLLFVFSFVCAFFYHHVKFERVEFSYIWSMLYNGSGFFVSRIFAAFYTALSAVFLGVFGSANQVALFGAAEQFYKAGQQVFSPFTQALYPYMVRTKNYLVFKRVVFICFLMAIVGACFGHIAGGYILELVFGSPFEAAADVLSIFMLVLVCSSFSMMMGYPALAPLGLSGKVNLSVILGGAVQLVMLAVLVISPLEANAIAVVILILLCELSVLFFRCYSFWRGFK